MANQGSSTWTGNAPAGTASAGSGSSSFDASRIFRREMVVTDADLRVDVAGYVSRVVAEDMDVSLDKQEHHHRNNLTMTRAKRQMTVGGTTDHPTGTYDAHIDDADMRIVGQEVVDNVVGDMVIKAQVESETLMAGAYVNTIRGAYLRICAWADFLCWGGWAEVDIARVEIAGAMIRAYWGYVHACIAKISRHSVFVDDFENRSEFYLALNDSHLTTLDIGSPGSGTDMEV